MTYQRSRAIHPLDHPIWHSLAHGWSALAQGDDLARRIDPLHGPFGAAADDSDASRRSLAALTPPDDELWLLGPDAIVAPPGLTVARTAMLAQMVAPTITPAKAAPPAWSVLGEADAADMLELALLTKPGPFRSHTHRLGRFIGMRVEGRLIAMAGERMRMPGFTEVSGVCTHPDWRGRGIAGALMRVVMQAMLDRGETPFLHAYAAHDKTIALYRTLGFEVRAELPMMVVTEPRD
ncbi:GNAT family N-acetyltransferase [Sphingobium sp. YR768]|uniref:GNAT family N-acetyltransferase n=1 Tax=Sphingobium sp. YR768 TaxID=1884365 RepID=UPI0008B152AB|nr:GNAT family N-acetyltransferase [Sphingobium sp. YR768]SEQ75524.1 Predicted acetyltransferase, GNAT family [Sphingobium sp. YR768]